VQRLFIAVQYQLRCHGYGKLQQRMQLPVLLPAMPIPGSPGLLQELLQQQ